MQTENAAEEQKQHHLLNETKAIFIAHRMHLVFFNLFSPFSPFSKLTSVTFLISQCLASPTCACDKIATKANDLANVLFPPVASSSLKRSIQAIFAVQSHTFIDVRARSQNARF